MAGAPECSTGLGVVIPPAPWAPVDLRDGAKTWCVEHFSENAIFAPAALGPKPHFRGPGIYTSPSYRHLLCGVARISRNAPVEYSGRGHFSFSRKSWKSGNLAPTPFQSQCQCQFSVSVSSVQFSYAMEPGGPTIPITNYQIPTLSATAESREASESPGGPTEELTNQLSERTN